MHRLWLNLRRTPGMHDLHHSDILSYALSHMAKELTHDKQGTIKGLQECIAEMKGRRGLGHSYYDLLDEGGPGYSLGSTHEETAKK